jgi:hypothetical protein
MAETTCPVNDSRIRLKEAIDAGKFVICSMTLPGEEPEWNIFRLSAN